MLALRSAEALLHASPPGSLVYEEKGRKKGGGGRKKRAPTAPSTPARKLSSYPSRLAPEPALASSWPSGKEEKGEERTSQPGGVDLLQPTIDPDLRFSLREEGREESRSFFFLFSILQSPVVSRGGEKGRGKVRFAPTAIDASTSLILRPAAVLAAAEERKRGGRGKTARCRHRLFYSPCLLGEMLEKGGRKGKRELIIIRRPSCIAITLANESPVFKKKIVTKRLEKKSDFLPIAGGKGKKKRIVTREHRQHLNHGSAPSPPSGRGREREKKKRCIVPLSRRCRAFVREGRKKGRSGLPKSCKSLNARSSPASQKRAGGRRKNLWVLWAYPSRASNAGERKDSEHQTKRKKKVMHIVRWC